MDGKHVGQTYVMDQWIMLAGKQYRRMNEHHIPYKCMYKNKTYTKETEKKQCALDFVHNNNARIFPVDKVLPYHRQCISTEAYIEHSYHWFFCRSIDR